MNIIRASLRVQGGSARNGYCIYGHPAPSAATGFAHALCARAGLRQTSGVIFVINEYSDRADSGSFGDNTFHMRRSAVRDTDKENKSQLDLPQNDFEATLIFTAEPTVAGPVQQRVEDVVERMRFAGGTLVKAEVSTTDESLEAALARPGAVLTEPDIAPINDDPFATLVEYSALKAGRKGWFVPSLVGYRLLEEPRQRQGARGGYPHAYADPLFWILEWQRSYKVKNSLTQHMWRMVRHDRIIKFTTHGEFSNV